MEGTQCHHFDVKRKKAEHSDKSLECIKNVCFLELY